MELLQGLLMGPGAGVGVSLPEGTWGGALAGVGAAHAHWGHFGALAPVAV